MDYSARNICIIKISAVGIFANVLLGIFKIIFGTLSHSIAIVTDAIENFTDALASAVIITGTFYSNKRPDNDHPYGYGRFEHIITSIISLIVLYAGIEAISETIEVIRHPHDPHYTKEALIIVIVSIIVKILYGCYTKRRAEHIRSKALEASGSEAIHHALISLLTLVAALITLLTDMHLEALASGIIGIFIIIEGIHLLKDSLSELMGQSVPKEKAKAILDIINSFDEVHGAYDLHLHDYGVDRLEGSVHVAVDDTLPAYEFDKLSRKIFKAVYEKENVLLYGIGLYSINTSTDPLICSLQQDILSYISSLENVKGTHGYYFNPETNYLSFDVGVSFDQKDLTAFYKEIYAAVKKKYPHLDLHIVVEYQLG